MNIFEVTELQKAPAHKMTRNVSLRLIKGTHDQSRNLSPVCHKYEGKLVIEAHDALSLWEDKPANDKETNELPTSPKFKACLMAITCMWCIMALSHSRVSIVVADGLVPIWYQNCQEYPSIINSVVPLVRSSKASTFATMGHVACWSLFELLSWYHLILLQSPQLIWWSGTLKQEQSETA